MLLLPRGPLVARIDDAIRDERSVKMVDLWAGGGVAVGAIGDTDALDRPADPAVDVARLSERLRHAFPGERAEAVARAIADREDVVDLGARDESRWRPPTLFELAALRDVLGDGLAGLLPAERVLVDRVPLRGAALNHCEHGHDGVARIRLLSTNGTTLAGRTHALVHELGHALIGAARRDGRPYRAAYGHMDYGRFLAPEAFETLCDEEALVRALADAWLLRRTAVTWSRTWAGAIDDAGRDLDADDLAAFVRFRLAQGLGLAATPVTVRRIGKGH